MLRSAARDSDVAARFGGEELVLLVRGDERSATAAAARVVAGLRELRFADGLRVTCSAGVAALAEGGDSASLFASADEALYEAKRRGKDRVVVARGCARRTPARRRRRVATPGSQRRARSRIGAAASAAAKRLPSSCASGRSLASTARSWKNGTSRCQGVTTLSEARSQAEHTTAMPTRSSRRAAKRISDGKSGLRQRSSAHQNSHGQSPRRTRLAAASRSSSPASPAMRPGQRLPERLARRRAHDGRVVELLVREQCIVRSAARGALVAHAVHGRMLRAGRRMTLTNCESVTP